MSESLQRRPTATPFFFAQSRAVTFVLLDLGRAKNRTIISQGHNVTPCDALELPAKCLSLSSQLGITVAFCSAAVGRYLHRHGAPVYDYVPCDPRPATTAAIAYLA